MSEELYDQLPGEGKSEYVRDAIRFLQGDDWVERTDYVAVKQNNKMLRWTNERLQGRVWVLSILAILLAVAVVMLPLIIAGTLP